MRSSQSFAARLSSIVVSITSALFVLTAVSSILLSYHVVGKEAVKLAQQELSKTALEFNKTLTQAETLIQTLSIVVAANIEDTTYMKQIVHDVVTSSPLVVGSTVAYAEDYFEGRHFCAPYACQDWDTGEVRMLYLGNEHYDYFHMEWFQMPYVTGQPLWTEPYYDEGGGNAPMSTYSVPVKNDKGIVVAVITLDLSLEWLQQKMQSIKPYKNCYSLMVSRTGRYLSHNDSERIVNETLFDSAVAEGDTTLFNLGRAMIAGKEGWKKIHYDKTKFFAVYGPLQNGWSASIVSPMSDVLYDLNRLTNLLILLSILGTFVVYSVIRRIIRRKLQPVTEFTYAALSMAKGNFQSYIPDVKTKDELLRLRNSLSYMQQSVGSYLTELRTTTAANERLESELNVARDIQMDMLTRNFPDAPDASLYANLLPAKEVGGDLYDCGRRGDVLYFAVGDVSGKGVPAALFMAICRAAVRFVSGMGLSLAGVMSKINSVMCDGNESGLFVTLFLARLDLTTGEMKFCNGGHNHLVVVPPTGSPYFLKAKPNLAIGLYDGFPYQDEQCTLVPGTRLILYTDGVTEAENAAKELYGDERLLDFAAHIQPSETDKEVVDRLYASVKAFTLDNAQNDDITMMSVSYHMPPQKQQ